MNTPISQLSTFSSFHESSRVTLFKTSWCYLTTCDLCQLFTENNVLVLSNDQSRILSLKRDEDFSYILNKEERRSLGQNYFSATLFCT